MAADGGSHQLTVVVVGVPAKKLHTQLHTHRVHSHTYKNTHSTTPHGGWWQQKTVAETVGF